MSTSSPVPVTANPINPTVVRTIYERMGSLAVTALVINSLFHLVLKTSFTSTLTVIVGSVFVEEHVLINLYIAFRERHKITKDWGLSFKEQLIFSVASLSIVLFVNFSVINIFSSPLIYRAIPHSWAVGTALAMGNIIFDLTATYKKEKTRAIVV